MYAEPVTINRSIAMESDPPQANRKRGTLPEAAGACG
jgi:hypothetical protein